MSMIVTVTILVTTIVLDERNKYDKLTNHSVVDIMLGNHRYTDSSQTEKSIKRCINLNLTCFSSFALIMASGDAAQSLLKTTRKPYFIEIFIQARNS